jgi:long-subunit fatty acid transport protein
MKKVVTFLAYYLLPVVYCFSQDFNPPIPKGDKTPFWSWNKIYTGGSLGLQFGTVTLINIAPDIGYKITERYSAGVGIRYMYFSDITLKPPYVLNIYGGSIFNRFIVTNFLFLHGEYEVLNGPWKQPFPSKRFNLNNVWVGGGFSQGAGNAAINIMALWNLNDEHYIPNPQIRMGISIGL